jgi:hypothetical protein
MLHRIPSQAWCRKRESKEANEEVVMKNFIVFNIKEGKIKKFSVEKEDISLLPEEERQNPLFFYEDSSYGKNGRLKNGHGWETVWAFPGRIFSEDVELKDGRGEVRKTPADPEKFFPLIMKFKNWQHYDAVEREEQLASLKNKLVELERRNEVSYAKLVEKESIISDCMVLIKMVYDLNEKGGPGSRKKVRELLASRGIEPCSECGYAICNCEE